MATIVKMQNQTFPIPDDLIALPNESDEAKQQRDSNLKRWLAQISPAATNATLQWGEENGQTVVRVTPKLGTKGSFVVDPLIGLLQDAPQSIPTTWSLVTDLKLLLASGKLTPGLLFSYQERITQALVEASQEERQVSEFYRRLKEAKAVPSPITPMGF